MAYPNPMATRVIKDHLYNAAADMGMIGASALVQGLMGSAWGWLFKQSNDRRYLNFIGELANRTVSKDVKNLATDVYKSRLPMFVDDNGRGVVHIPSAVDRYGNYTNDDGSMRNNYHSYDPVNYNSNISDKFKYNFRTPFLRNSGQTKKGGSNKKSNKPHRNFRNYSEGLLETTINMMSERGYDFNEGDFSLSSVLYNLKMKIMGWLPHTEQQKDEYSKNVLQACYEFLEENGEDAYPIMVNAIESASKSGNFSECDETDLQQFFKAAESYSKLSTLQKLYVKDKLIENYGSDISDEFLWSINKYNSKGVPPTKKRMNSFKLLAIFSIFSIILAGIFNYFKEKDRENKERNKIN